MFLRGLTVTRSFQTWIQTYCVFGREHFTEETSSRSVGFITPQSNPSTTADADCRSVEIASNSKQILAYVHFPFFSILTERSYLCIEINLIPSEDYTIKYYFAWPRVGEAADAHRRASVASNRSSGEFSRSHADSSCLTSTARTILYFSRFRPRTSDDSYHADCTGRPLESPCCSPNRVARRIPILLVALVTFILYADILVILQTTAGRQRICRRSSTVLAILCFLLATLTIAARCCASKSAPHPFSKLSVHPEDLDPSGSGSLHFRAHSSSKLVLSRLRRQRSAKGDIRIIQPNYYVRLFTFRSSSSRPSSDKSPDRFRRQARRSILSGDHVDSGTHLRKIASEKNAADDYADVSRREAVSNGVEEKDGFVKELSGNDNSYDFVVNPGVVVAASNGSVGNKTVTISDEDGGGEVWENKSWDQFTVNSNGSEVRTRDEYKSDKGTLDGSKRPMPPAHEEENNSLSQSTVLVVVVVSSVVLTVALALVTCVLNHYRGGTAADPHDAGQTPTTAPYQGKRERDVNDTSIIDNLPRTIFHIAKSHDATEMLSVVSAGAATGVGGMADRLRGHHGHHHHHGGTSTRDLAASRDRQVRLHAVHTDIAINMPPSIALPDGEDHPFSNARLHIRDSDQESEIYQKCIKPPPNRTVLESESPPPYRSSSAGLLGSIGSSSSSSSSDWSGGNAPLVVRCHSMSSTSKRPEIGGPSGQKTDFIQRTVKIFTGKKSQPPPAPSLPAVIVPTRPRNISEQQQQQQQNSTGRPKPSI